MNNCFDSECPYYDVNLNACMKAKNAPCWLYEDGEDLMESDLNG